MSILGAYFVFNGIFGIFQYHYVLIKRSYLGSLGLATYIGLIMVYLYLFNPYFVKDPLFYFFALMQKSNKKNQDKNMLPRSLPFLPPAQPR